MKKIERLQWIEKVFGSGFAIEYIFCKNWGEIIRAIDYFEGRGKGWGLRTDTNTETIQQSYLCPFLFSGTRDAAAKIYQENQERLYYIVCENLPEVLCHGVAELVDAEHIFIEFNDKERNIAQRDMYDRPKNLRRLGVGPSSYVFHMGIWVRSFPPEETSHYGFDKIYYPMIWNRIEEITFSVKTNKQVIIW